MLLCYSMLIFTDFMNSGIIGIEQIGDLFIYLIIEIFSVSIFFVFQEYYKQRALDYKKRQSQKRYEEGFKVHR